MKSYWPKTLPHLLFVLALGYWIWILKLVPHLEAQQLPDSISYLNFFQDDLNSLYRTPGYPAFLWLLKQISILLHVHLGWVIFIAQLLLFWISFSLWMRMLKNKPGRILLAIVLLANPSFFIYSYTVLTEILCLFLLTFSAFFVYLFFEDKKNTKLLWSLFFLCLATLVRPGCYYFLLLCLVALLFYFLKVKAYREMILVGLIYALSIVPVQWRNHQNYHVFTLTLIDRVTLHRYLRNAVVSSIDYVDPSENLKKQDSLDQLQLPDLERIPDARAHVAYYHQQWQSIWMEHKGVIAQVYLQNLFSNTHTGNTFLQTSVSSKTKEAVFNLTRIWNMLFVGLLVFFLPLLIFLTRKHRKFLLLAYLFYGLALYLFLTSGISFWQGDRLHSLLFPFVAISLLFFLSICVENKWRFIGAEKKDE